MSKPLPEGLEILVREALERDASDVFLLPGEPISMRVRGIIERGSGAPLIPEEIHALAREAIGDDNLNKVGPELGQYRCWCGIPGDFNAGISVGRTHSEYSIVLRVMPARLFTVEELRVPPALIEAVLAPSGLVIVAGPAGSGKTTTAYTLVDHINAHVDGCHINTVEGPSHMCIPPKKAFVQQREIGVDVPNALEGVRVAAAQDLDVLFMGDIADGDVLLACVDLADTGNLVIAQMRAFTPTDAIQRLLDLFPNDIRLTARRDLARVLRAVSSQILVPAASNKGRLAAMGVLIPDNEMRAAIANGSDFMTRRSPWPEGCQTMTGHLDDMVASGLITSEAADQGRAIIASWGNG